MRFAWSRFRQQDMLFLPSTKTVTFFSFSALAVYAWGIEDASYQNADGAWRASRMCLVRKRQMEEGQFMKAVSLPEQNGQHSESLEED